MQRTCVVATVIFALLAPATAQKYSDFTTPRPLPPNSYLVVGIMGGIERWDSENRPVRRVALDLRSRAIPGVYAETVEHGHRGLALKLIRESLDRDGDGKLSPEEASSARIILYGHSMGAAGVVKLARDLKTLGIPVLLTIQVDSVGTRDGKIPSNVRKAANFYQHTSKIVRGQATIKAEDPTATQIIGNFKFDYKHKDVDLSGITWPERIAGGAHTKMEFDPDVWRAVERLILGEIK